VKLKLGTRGSDLARAQSMLVAESLAARGVDCELTIIATAGDRSMAPSFGSIGAQGVFVRELEQALVAGEIDFAVHSYKDLPTRSPPELVVAAAPERIDVADFLLIHKKSLIRRTDQILPVQPKSRIGTSSARRQAWIRHYRRDLEVLPLRGNVPTRVGRFEAGDFEAIVLAGAGVRRLQLAGPESIRERFDQIRMVRLDPDEFVPAPAQGALALQCRRDDASTLAALAELDDEPTRRAIAVERDVLARAEGGCDAAFGAFCRPVESGWELYVMAEVETQVRATLVAGPAPEPLAELGWANVLAGELGGLAP
jgi:hydroxymethylbilane synthase